MSNFELFRPAITPPFRRTLPACLLGALALCVAGLGGCRWENPNAAENEEEREEIDDALQGTWRTLCQLIESGAEEEVWLRTVFEFSGASVTRTDNEYPDSSCLEADVVIESRGSFDVGRELTADDGQQVRELDFDYTEVKVTLGDTTDPPTPGRQYDILYLREDNSGFFLGERDETQDGSEEDKRPTAVDFSNEYLKQ